MPSFDIVSKVDLQTLDNAVNNARKELETRYDFRGTGTEIDLDKKTLTVTIVTENEMKLEAAEDILAVRLSKQGIDPNAMDRSKEEYASGNKVRKEIKIRSGIDKDTARQIVKVIKDTKLKVEPAIQDEQVRVSGKKIDDLQSVMAQLRTADVGLPLQFTNLK